MKKNGKVYVITWPEDHGPEWLCGDNVRIGLEHGGVNLEGVTISDITTIEIDGEQVGIMDLLSSYMEIGTPDKINEALERAIGIVEGSLKVIGTKKKKYPVDNISAKQGCHRVWTFDLDGKQATVVLDTRDRSLCGRIIDVSTGNHGDIISGKDFPEWLSITLGWNPEELHLKEAQNGRYLFHVPRYCGNCCHLSPKESEQSEKGESHICSLLKRKIVHDGFHPLLPTPHDCPK